MQALGKLWEELCNLIIRPQKYVYDPQVLGPQTFSIRGKKYERDDFFIESRGYRIICSHFKPFSKNKSEKFPVVIYCHGNCGSRIDALDTVQVLLPFGISVLAFDFAGCGLSEGKYISLGYFEKIDLGNIIKFMRENKNIGKIGLWGRSMGAATSIMYSTIDPTISCFVADSAFTSLVDVITGLVLSFQNWVPKPAIAAGIFFVRKSIQSRAKFDIYENNPLKYAKKCTVPALFAHAEGDDFIKISHAEKLLEKFGGDKMMIRFDGDHNSQRPSYFYEAAVSFFYSKLIGDDEEKNCDLSKVKKNGSLLVPVIKKDKSNSIAPQQFEDAKEIENDVKEMEKRHSMGGTSQPQIVIPQSFKSNNPSNYNIEPSKVVVEADPEDLFLLQAQIESIQDSLNYLDPTEQDDLVKIRDFEKTLKELKEKLKSIGG